MIFIVFFIFFFMLFVERGGVKDLGEGILIGVWIGDIVGLYDV